MRAQPSWVRGRSIHVPVTQGPEQPRRRVNALLLNSQRGREGLNSQRRNGVRPVITDYP